MSDVVVAIAALCTLAQTHLRYEYVGRTDIKNGSCQIRYIAWFLLIYGPVCVIAVLASSVTVWASKNALHGHLASKYWSRDSRSLSWQTASVPGKSSFLFYTLLG